MREPIRGKQSSLGLDTYGRSCADDDMVWVGDYLHSNHYLTGARLQTALNRNRRRRESPAKAARGGLSRREWRRKQSAERAQRG
jgi:hypothetical protein